MKFKVHVYEEFRREYMTEANSAQEAVDRVFAAIDAGEACSVFGEWTGDYNPEAVVDPINEDGSTDYENSVTLTGAY